MKRDVLEKLSNLQVDLMNYLGTSCTVSFVDGSLRLEFQFSFLVDLDDLYDKLRDFSSKICAKKGSDGSPYVCLYVFIETDLPF